MHTKVWSTSLHFSLTVSFKFSVKLGERFIINELQDTWKF